MKAKKWAVAWNYSCPSCGEDLPVPNGSSMGSFMWTTENLLDPEVKVNCPGCSKLITIKP